MNFLPPQCGGASHRAPRTAPRTVGAPPRVCLPPCGCCSDRIRRLYFPSAVGTPVQAKSASAGPSGIRKGIKGSSVCVTRPILFRPQTGSRSRLRVNGSPSEPYPLAATNGQVEAESGSSLEVV